MQYNRHRQKAIEKICEYSDLLIFGKLILIFPGIWATGGHIIGRSGKINRCVQNRFAPFREIQTPFTELGETSFFIAVSNLETSYYYSNINVM